MTNQKQGKAPQEASKDEGLTRRAAMKRIAAGLAGVGVVVVAGIISPIAGKDQYGDSAPRNRKNASSPIAGKDEYGDSAPK